MKTDFTDLEDRTLRGQWSFAVWCPKAGVGLLGMVQLAPLHQRLYAHPARAEPRPLNDFSVLWGLQTVTVPSPIPSTRLGFWACGSTFRRHTGNMALQLHINDMTILNRLHVASPTWSSTEHVARPATKWFHPFHGYANVTCAAPAWWSRDQSAWRWCCVVGQSVRVSHVGGSRRVLCGDVGWMLDSNSCLWDCTFDCAVDVVSSWVCVCFSVLVKLRLWSSHHWQLSSVTLLWVLLCMYTWRVTCWYIII